MITKTYLKKAAAVFCLLFIAKAALAQTYAPVWSLPPFYGKMQTGGTPNPPVLSAEYNNSWGMYGIPISYEYVGRSFPEGSNYNANYSSNLIANAAGKPLAYVLDGNVFDSTGFPIYNNASENYTDFVLNWAHYGGNTASGQPYNANNWGLFQTITGFAETCVVPNPQNCKQYYIFTAGAILPLPLQQSYDDNGTAGLYHFAQYVYYPFYAMLDLSKTNYNGTPGKDKGAHFYVSKYMLRNNSDYDIIVN
jgi:hypothetical protein